MGQRFFSSSAFPNEKRDILLTQERLRKKFDVLPEIAKSLVYQMIPIEQFSKEDIIKILAVSKHQSEEMEESHCGVEEFRRRVGYE